MYNSVNALYQTHSSERPNLELFNWSELYAHQSGVRDIASNALVPELSLLFEEGKMLLPQQSRWQTIMTAES